MKVAANNLEAHVLTGESGSHEEDLKMGVNGLTAGVTVLKTIHESANKPE